MSNSSIMPMHRRRTLVKKRARSDMMDLDCNRDQQQVSPQEKGASEVLDTKKRRMKKVLRKYQCSVMVEYYNSNSHLKYSTLLKYGQAIAGFIKFSPLISPGDLRPYV